MQILNPYFCTTETFQINGSLLSIITPCDDSVCVYVCAHAHTRTRSLQEWGKQRRKGREEDGRRLIPSNVKWQLKLSKYNLMKFIFKFSLLIFIYFTSSIHLFNQDLFCFYMLSKSLIVNILSLHDIRSLPSRTNSGGREIQGLQINQNALQGH